MKVDRKVTSKLRHFKTSPRTCLELQPTNSKATLLTKIICLEILVLLWIILSSFGLVPFSFLHGLSIVLPWIYKFWFSLGLSPDCVPFLGFINFGFPLDFPCIIVHLCAQNSYFSYRKKGKESGMINHFYYYFEWYITITCRIFTSRCME